MIFKIDFLPCLQIFNFNLEMKAAHYRSLSSTVNIDLCCIISTQWSNSGQRWVRWIPNGTNPGLFQIRSQYILAQRAKMYWNLIWKSPGFVPFGANLTHFGSKSGHPVSPSSRHYLCPPSWLNLSLVRGMNAHGAGTMSRTEISECSPPALSCILLISRAFSPNLATWRKWRHRCRERRVKAVRFVSSVGQLVSKWRN